MATYTGSISGRGGATGGSKAYGSIPGQTNLPNPSADLGKVFPNLSQANTSVSKDILNQLNGELSPDTISNIKDNAASFGVASGLPGSQFSSYRGLRNLGISTQDLQNQGIQNYNATVPTISRTQTVSPETQIALDQNNKVLASAPDPEAAAAEQQRLFDQYLDRLTNPAGGTGSYSLTSGGGSGGFNERQFLAQNPGAKKIAPFTYSTPVGADRFL